MLLSNSKNHPSRSLAELHSVNGNERGDLPLGLLRLLGLGTDGGVRHHNRRTVCAHDMNSRDYATASCEIWLWYKELPPQSHADNDYRYW